MIKRGSTGPAVKQLQYDLARLAVAKLEPDGAFGPKTEDAVKDCQRWLGLSMDGVVGPITAAAITATLTAEWTLGSAHKLMTDRGEIEVYGGLHPDKRWIPDHYGFASNFGGPEDSGDYMYGQACINAETMAQVHARYNELLTYDPPVFRPDVTDPLPRGMGISWALNPQSYYCAMRWPRRPYPDPRVHRITAQLDGVLVVMVPTDHGPAARLRRAIDLSKGAFDVLKCGTDKRRVVVGWAADRTPIGVYEVTNG